ncbi:hypothetical protein PspLS_06300 [Pyricularia sp. CBS 133598]|nr:hypothetical protein PspLS_06300 [Pyricularia sp. CBS 133598]
MKNESGESPHTPATTITNDATIVSTIVPSLINEFDSQASSGWYGAIYLLVAGTTQPSVGKIYAIFPPYLVFLGSVALLAAGSLTCALAQNAATFIGGRAVTGLGASGMLSGCLVIVALITPISSRPAYTTVLGGLEGIALIAGPLIGGSIADSIGWRWCFWINLPCSALIALAALRMAPRNLNKGSVDDDKPWSRRLADIDFLGGLGIVGSLVCLFLALQWGGAVYPWSDARVVALLVLFAVSFVAMGLYQSRLGERATFPVRLFRNREFTCVIAYSFLLASSQFVTLYYLPLWFQKVEGLSAKESGIKMLPMVVAVIVVSILGGAGASVTGYQAPFMILATILGAVGSGMLHTLTPGISIPRQIGYQILFGSGSGMGMQQGIVASQIVVAARDVPYSISAVMLVNTVGGACFVSVSQALLLSELTEDGVGLNDGDKALAYNRGVAKIFLLTTVLCTATVATWPFLGWGSLKDKKVSQEAGRNAEERE